MFKKNKGILLDRDGVLIEDRKNYTRNISEVKILPDVKEAIASLWEIDYIICIVTNQSGISKGLYSDADVQEIHNHLENEFRKLGSGNIFWYYCPHQDSDHCNCRKPKSGLLQKAIQEHQLIPEDTWMVGDNIRDIVAGKSSNCPTCLVLTGLGKNFYGSEMSPVPDKVYCDLNQFVQEILIEGGHNT